VRVQEKRLYKHKVAEEKQAGLAHINMCIAMEFLYSMRCTFLLNGLSKINLLKHLGG